MWKKILIAVLGLSFAFELLFAAAGFVAPSWTMTQFQIAPTPETLFLGFIISWFLLFVALVCGLALHQISKNKPQGWPLCYVLGLWWVGVGIGIFLTYGRPDNLVLDSLKGALILGAALKTRPKGHHATLAAPIC